MTVPRFVMFFALMSGISMLASCAKSPEEILAMNPSQLRQITDWDLCKIYGRPDMTRAIRDEMSRRKINCPQVIAEQTAPPARGGNSAKLDNSACPQIQLISGGKELYANIIPHIAVEYKNNSKQRLGIYFDVLTTNEVVIPGLRFAERTRGWNEYGPITARPGEGGVVPLDKSSDSQQVHEIRIVRCVKQ